MFICQLGKSALLRSLRHGHRIVLTVHIGMDRAFTAHKARHFRQIGEQSLAV